MTANNNFHIEGLEAVRDKIARLENPAEFFDEQVVEAKVFALKRLIRDTNVDALGPGPHTANMWSAQKLEDSLYQIDNVNTTDPDGSPTGKKYSIAAIINVVIQIGITVDSNSLSDKFTDC